MPATATPTEPRLRQRYRDSIAKQLMGEFGYDNVMQVPRITKVAVNIGLGDQLKPDYLKLNPNGVVPTLDHDARRFFDLKFNSPEFNRTKEQVVDRLFAVKRIRTLSRMFSAPKSKLDFFKEMGSAKGILINVPRSLLQEDGVEIVGRFFISMILLAAHKRQLLPKEQRLPCFVYIDECHDFIKRDPKIPVILDQARKLNVGLILAHQRLQQLQSYVLDALYGATAIKFASQVA